MVHNVRFYSTSFRLVFDCHSTGQTSDWQLHRRVCKKMNQFTSSVVFQALEEHEKMDSFLLTHLVAHLSTLPKPYQAQQENDSISIFLSLLPRKDHMLAPPVVKINPPPPTDLVERLFERFGNNNFTIQNSWFIPIGHGIMPLASRLFNHSCVPNAATRYTLSPFKPPEMHVIALRDIGQNEEVSSAKQYRPYHQLSCNGPSDMYPVSGPSSTPVKASDFRNHLRLLVQMFIMRVSQCNRAYPRRPVR